MDVIAVLKEFDPALDQAEQEGDATRLAELWEELWSRIPEPTSEWNVQGRVSLATNQFIDLSDWQALQAWIPRYAEQYGDDDPSTRIRIGILEYNTGDEQEAQRILADVLDEYGPTVFEGRKPYLRIAKKGQQLS